MNKEFALLTHSQPSPGEACRKRCAPSPAEGNWDDGICKINALGFPSPNPLPLETAHDTLRREKGLAVEGRRSPRWGKMTWE